MELKGRAAAINLPVFYYCSYFDMAQTLQKILCGIKFFIFCVKWQKENFGDNQTKLFTRELLGVYSIYNWK